MKIIDTHAHLDEIENLPAVLARAKDSGLTKIIAVGQNHESNIKTLAISNVYPSLVYPALGLHPWHVGIIGEKHMDDTLQFIDSMSNHIIAIGEIGMDYDKRVLKLASKDVQKNAFNKLLYIAVNKGKPIIVHSRYAWKDCFGLVAEAGISKAVFHWFTGFSSVLRDIIEAGYYISATPAAEYHDEHRRAIKEAPLDRLLLETDSPVSYGGDNRYQAEPGDALRSLRAVAAIKELPENDVAEQLFMNTQKFMGFSA